MFLKGLRDSAPGASASYKQSSTRYREYISRNYHCEDVIEFETDMGMD